MRQLRIRFYREKQGLSLEELSEMTGIDRYKIQAFESGFESPLLNEAIDLAEALGVTLSELVKEV